LEHLRTNSTAEYAEVAEKIMGEILGALGVLGGE